MARKMFDWMLGVAGPVFVKEAGFRIGLASRNFAADNNLAPKGKVMQAAIATAKERNDKLVRVEYLLLAADGELDISTVGEPGEKLRRQMARTRKADRRTAAEAATAEKREARKQRAADRKRKAEAAKAEADAS